MSCRISRLIKRTDLVRKPKVIPMSRADERDNAILQQRREERRRREEEARRKRPEGHPA